MGFSNSPASTQASARTMGGDTPRFVIDDFSADKEEASIASNSSAGDITGDRPAVYQTLMSEENRAARRGRKGHTKSRTGCYNCKKARIKCKENRPSCDYCSHRDLKCEWPDLYIKQASPEGVLIRRPTASPVPTAISSPGPVFTMQDFRLFNHFIQCAYPHHPPLNDSVWTHEIPSIASNNEFLLHSMLALSASDIAESSPSSAASELQCVAMAYRVKAIAALNEAIGKPLESVEQGNAVLATCFSLLFQSTLINDGLVEYMTFIRGVLLVAIHMGEKNIRFLFQHMFEQIDIIQSELKDSRLINPAHAHRACRSLELICPLIQNPRELELYGYLLSAARALFTSCSDAYSNLTKIYGLFSYFMSHEEFALYIDVNNEAGKLLQSHFSALQLIMTPFTRRETTGRRKSASQNNDGITARWLVALHQNIKSDMRKYYEWPIWIQEEVAAGRLELTFDHISTLQIS